jgi:MYXO-CTERM domain-containing protein
MADCGRVDPLDDGESRTILLEDMGLDGETDGYFTATKQFSLEVPDDGTRLLFSVESFKKLSPSYQMGWTLFVRRGEPVSFKRNQLGYKSLFLADPEDFDWSVEAHDEDHFLYLDADSDLPLEPGAVYYFALASRNTGPIYERDQYAEMVVSGEVWTADPAPPISETKACGCTSSTHPPGAWLLLTLGAYFWRRSGKNRSSS